MNRLFLPLIISVAFILPIGARTFTDTTGRTIDAEVVEVLENSVKLQIKGKSKIHDIPFSTLSPSDVDYLKSLSEEKASSEPPESKKKKSSSRKTAAQLMAEYGLKDNFDTEWPGLISASVSPEITIISENEEEGVFIYHSPNYEFKCDVRLSNNVVKKFAVMFEATRELCRQLPISMMKAHVPGEQFRNTILLFEKEHTYIANGGPPDSAGVFMSSMNSGIVMVPLTSLGVRKVGSGYMFDHGESNKTLIHELTHQLTDWEYYQEGSRGWFSEGLAEYCGVTPYRSGKFMLKTNLSDIEEYATAYGKNNTVGRALGENIIAPNLRNYMLMPYSQFGANPNMNYGLGLLITTYFFHMEDDRSNITNFLKALKEGKNGEAALEVLLNGRSYDELEEQIHKAWRSKGVKINFQ